MGLNDKEVSRRFREWSSIRDDAFLVTQICRREDDLWALPTCDNELSAHYAMPGSREFAIRRKSAFGHGSITVSLKALQSTEVTTGSRPDFVAWRVLNALREHRREDGGYGSHVGRKDGNFDINAIPRHTASAVVLRLLFENLTVLLIEGIKPSIEWLLQRQLATGGWAYDPSGFHVESGAMSTAMSICALCLFAEKASALTPSLQPREFARIGAAVSNAYGALIRQRRHGAWDASADGTPEDNQISDSCFDIWVLLKANEHQQLTAFVESARTEPAKWAMELWNHLLPGGWPGHVGNDTPEAATTVTVLQLLYCNEMPPVESQVAARMEEASDLVLAAWRDGLLSRTMTLWDWTCLAELAAVKSCPMTETERLELVRKAEKLRNTWLRNKLSSRDLLALPVHVREPVRYALTEGDTLQLRNAMIDEFRPFVWKWIVEIVGGGIVAGLIATWLWERYLRTLG